MRSPVSFLPVLKPKSVAWAVGGLVATYAMVGGVGNAAPPSPVASVYTATTQVLLVDSVALDDTVTLNKPVAGVHGIPATATAVMLDLTAQNGSASGAVYAYPHQSSKPSVPEIQFQPGQNTSVTVTVAVGTDGHIVFQSTGGALTFSATITGYFTPAGSTGPAGGVLTGTYPNPGLAPGAVAASNINSTGAVGVGQVLTAVGSGAAWKPPSLGVFTRTTVVHGNVRPTVAGANLAAAVAALPAHQSNLVFLEPGTFDIGTGTLTLPPNTWIEGSGTTLTTIQAETGFNAGVALTTAAATGIASLTLDEEGSTQLAMRVPAATTIEQTDIIDNPPADNDFGSAIQDLGPLLIQGSSISATVTNDGQSAVQVQSAIDDGGLTLIDDTISAPAATGVDDQQSAAAVVIRSSTITADVGIRTDGQLPITIDASQVTGTGLLFQLGGTIHVGASRVQGPFDHNANGTAVCVDSYNASYVALVNDCYS